MALDTAPRLVHPAQVAGTFYPADPAALGEALHAVWRGARASTLGRPKAIVAPHAGLAFSGPIAASAFKAVEAARDQITRVVLIGPAHRHAFQGLAIHPADAFATPSGVANVDERAQALLSLLPEVSVDAAPFEGEHSLEMPLLFVQRAFPRAEIVPILTGDATGEAVARVLATVWGGPETLVVVSSDLTHFLTQDEAAKTDRETRALVEALRPDGMNARRACGHRALAGLLHRARDLDLRATGIDLRTSADTRGTPERVVGYGAFAFEYSAEARLSDADRRLLLDTAARALRHAAANGGAVPTIDVKGALPSTLSATRATFVTLEKDGRLRGCIGSLALHRTLIADVVTNAVKAGFGDPRFPALTVEEISGLTLSVSILSHPRPIAAASRDALIAALNPDVDGLMIADQGKQALFLPSVWKSLPKASDFLAQLTRKAGLPDRHWSSGFTARRFRTESFGARLG